MRLSPFVPVHFPDGNPADGLESRYVQVWAPTDHIMLQVIAAAGEAAPAATLNDARTGAAIGAVDWQRWQMNSAKTVYFHEYAGLSEGLYTLTIADKTSDAFRVTADKGALGRTTLIQYRFRDNRQRDDVVSVIDRMPVFFDFRVPGGFKDSGWQFGVSNEQFTTQHEDVVELYANDYTLKTFTLGNSIGVPVWYAELLNRLLTCTYVYFGGVRYTRNDTEVPSMNTLVEGLDSFVFTQVLRKAQLLDPEIEETNQIAIRRVDEDSDRLTGTEGQTILIV